MDKQKELGSLAEARVAEYLIKEKFTILARNYTKRTGEIDLIARKNKLIVFVEVKARARVHFDLCELIVPSKRRKIMATAKLYLIEHGLTDASCRFDVALLIGDALEYIADAFTEE